MDTQRSINRTVSICSYILLAMCLLPAFAACGAPTSPTPSPAPPPTTTSPQESPTVAPINTLPLQPTLTLVCTDNLLFVDDVTIPDDTVVASGSKLDKQWLVQNDGDCNWDSRYRLRLISGDTLGASPEQALYPARAGTQINLRILFTAPQEAGNYMSEWQAFDASGIPFGESFFIKIVVQQ